MLPGFFWTRGSVEKSKHTEISHKLSVKKREKNVILISHKGLLEVRNSLEGSSRSPKVSLLCPSVP